MTTLVGKSTDAGKKVYSATMYIPNVAFEFLGEAIFAAKQLVFAFKTRKLVININIMNI